MKLTIGKKLWIGFGCAFLITTLIGVFGYQFLSKDVSNFTNIIEKDTPYINLAYQVKIEMLQHRRYEKDFFLNIGKPEKQKKYIEKFNAKSDSIKKKFEEIVKMIEVGELKKTVMELEPNYDLYYQGFFSVVKQVKSDPTITPQKANKLMTPNKEAIHALEEGLDTIAMSGLEVLKKSATIAIKGGENGKVYMLVLVLFGMVLVAVLAILIPGSINRAINKVIESLTQSSHQVVSASGQVSSASQSLAEGSSEQAASIEETSSSLEEMSSMTAQTADNANHADALMKDANEIVTEANKSMKELTTSMDDISQASDETSKIIKTIDEIAFQTNLLALNAAVEAARAGEAGAGFAVVADEVRNLAMRAADAAKNTSSLIEDTVGKISTGSGLVTLTNEAFEKVADNSQKVAALIAEISSASTEQSQGIRQVNTVVTEMDRVVQQNAANAEESASAAEELNAQAEQMKAMVQNLMALVKGGVRVAQTDNLKHQSNPQINKQKVRQLTSSPQNESIPKDIIPLDDDDDFKAF